MRNYRCFKATENAWKRKQRYVFVVLTGCLFSSTDIAPHGKNAGLDGRAKNGKPKIAMKIKYYIALITLPPVAGREASL